MLCILFPMGLTCQNGFPSTDNQVQLTKGGMSHWLNLSSVSNGSVIHIFYAAAFACSSLPICVTVFPLSVRPCWFVLSSCLQQCSIRGRLTQLVTFSPTVTGNTVRCVCLSAVSLCVCVRVCVFPRGHLTQWVS